MNAFLIIRWISFKFHYCKVASVVELEEQATRREIKLQFCAEKRKGKKIYLHLQQRGWSDASVRAGFFHSGKEGRIAQRFLFLVSSNAAVPLLQSEEDTARLRGGGKRERAGGRRRRRGRKRGRETRYMPMVYGDCLLWWCGMRLLRFWTKKNEMRAKFGDLTSETVAECAENQRWEGQISQIQMRILASAWINI